MWNVACFPLSALLAVESDQTVVKVLEALVFSLLVSPRRVCECGVSVCVCGFFYSPPGIFLFWFI